MMTRSEVVDLCRGLGFDPSLVTYIVISTDIEVGHLVDGKIRITTIQIEEDDPRPLMLTIEGMEFQVTDVRIEGLG